MVGLRPSAAAAAARNTENEGLREPLRAKIPLDHGFPRESSRTNQTNIVTRGSFRAIVRACLAYRRCFERLTPFGPGGLVSWPYSVIQIGMFRRPNHRSSARSKRGIATSVTLG